MTKKLDPKKYPPTLSPWPYRTVAAYMTVWDYVPVGDHSEQYLLDPDGFLVWERTDHKTGEKKAFVISTPKWSADGYDMPEPVWPSRVIVREMEAQEVFQRAGSPDENTKGLIRAPMNRKDGK